MIVEKYKKRYERQKELIEKRNDEISKLKKQISKLEHECESKDSVISSVMPIKDNLDVTVEDLKKKYLEFDEVITELKRMRSVLDQTIFKGRWKLIKLLMK